jgi:hypothetical protein
MTETNEKAEGAAGGQETHGDVQDAPREDEGELRAEEESAKAMEAEVPHPPGYPEPGQEQPS